VALEKVEAMAVKDENVKLLLQFIKHSERGWIR
jgi:hypothetical protein